MAQSHQKNKIQPWLRMAEPIYKELAKHLQSMTVSVMEKVLPQLANGPFNVMYGSEARKIAKGYTSIFHIERCALLSGLPFRDDECQYHLRERVGQTLNERLDR
jgi:hypothetical protein